MPTAKQIIIEDLEFLDVREDVYCINVPGVGHFSLANGAIVKNCDSLRYLCMSLHKTNQGLTAENFNKILNQHKYGAKGDPLYLFSKGNNQYKGYG